MKHLKKFNETNHYANKNYARTEDLTHEEIEKLLRDVHEGYDEYKDEPFIDMVKKFAKDDFYNLHYVAQAYLEV